MPELNTRVQRAFQTLGVAVDATRDDAGKAYKRQAIKLHPDKNPNNPAATKQFQELGAAWEIVLQHYEDPAKSYIPDFAQDDDMDDEEFAEFFQFLFAEMLFGRYSSRKAYRSQRNSGAPFVFMFGSPPGSHRSYHGPSYAYSNGGPFSSRALDDRAYAYDPQRSQAKEKAAREKERAEYLKRVADLEREVREEERLLKTKALEKAQTDKDLMAAYQQAFAAAKAADAPTLVRLVDRFELDINSPEKVGKGKAWPTNYQSLLHAAARSGDESILTFLLDKGANPAHFNDAKLQPFHVAVLNGNSVAVKHLLQRRLNGKPLPGCHPSKAAPDGRTPLQLAILGRSAELVELLTKEATVHDVEKCWGLAEAAPFRDILLGKKGFVDPQVKKRLAQEECQRVAAEAAERERLAKERKEQEQARREQKLARQREQELAAAKKKEEEVLRQRTEKLAKEEAARAKEEAARAKEAEARAQAELESKQRESEARARVEAERKAKEEEKEEARRRAQAAKAKADADAKKMKLERERLKKEEEERAAVARRELQLRKDEEERQRAEKRAETLRRLAAQAEEHRKMAEAKARSTALSAAAAPLDVEQREKERRAAQSARDKARILERKKMKQVQVEAEKIASEWEGAQTVEIPVDLFA